MSDSNSSPNDTLGILANAISDVGYWSWWASRLPDSFQIEFGGTQLLFGPPTTQEPPPTKIAIQFKRPADVFFISRSEPEENFEWADLLHNDQMEPPTCSHGEFSFGKNDSTEAILAEVNASKSLLNNEHDVREIMKQPCCIAFWCGDIGMAIGAEEMQLLNHSGVLALESVSDFNAKWWEYWRAYWNKIDTIESFPKDYACEVTIPGGE